MKEQRRYPELGCSVMHHVIQQNQMRTPEAIQREVDRILEEMAARDRRKRWEAPSWLLWTIAVAMVGGSWGLLLLWRFGG